jgi:hypothetical protein
LNVRLLNDLYNVGTIKYLSTGELLGSKFSSEKRISTCKMEHQKGRTQLPRNRTYNSAGSRMCMSVKMRKLIAEKEILFPWMQGMCLLEQQVSRLHALPPTREGSSRNIW